MSYKVWIEIDQLCDSGMSHEPEAKQLTVLLTQDRAKAIAFAADLHRLGVDMAATKAELEGSKTP